MSFLYKKLVLEDKEKIKLEAKKIMDSFGVKLAQVKNLSVEGVISRKVSYREETLQFPCDKKFRELILSNAKNKKDNFIVAEKKKW